MVAVEFILISLIYNLVTDLTDKTCCSISCDIKGKGRKCGLENTCHRTIV